MAGVMPSHDAVGHTTGRKTGSSHERIRWSRNDPQSLSVFHGAELAFPIRIVIGDGRTAIRFGDAQVRWYSATVLMLDVIAASDGVVVCFH